MSHNLTESATYTADVTVPDDGDARNAASVNTAFQALANRTKFLKAQTDALHATITRSVPLASGLAVDNFSPGAFKYLNTSAWDSSIDQGDLVQFPLDPPVGCTIVGASARLAGKGGHGALPAIKAKLRVRKFSATNVATTVATVTDSSGTTGAYEAQHTLTLTFSEAYDPTCSYVIEVLDESDSPGTNYEGINLTALTFTYTT